MHVFKRLRDLVFRSEYRRNVLSLLTGTALAQLIPILFSPVMTRIYTPIDYGVFGVYIAISSLFTILATFEYVHVVLLVQTKREESNAVFLCLIIGLLASLSSFIILFFLKATLSEKFSTKEVESLLMLIPFAVLLESFKSVIIILVNKRKKFKLLAVARLSASILTVSLSIILGLLVKGPIGLIIALFAGNILITIILLFKNRKEILDLEKVSKNAVLDIAKRYKKFPIYSLPTAILGNWSSQLPVYILAILVNPAVVGLFNYSVRILGLPITLLAQSLREVFMQKAAEDYNTLGSCRPIYIRTLKNLAFSGILPFIGLVVFAPDLFEIVFGANWREAGEYSRVLAIMYFLKLIVNPLSYTYFIANKQNEDFILHIFTIILVGSSLIVSYNLFENVKITLLSYALSYSLIYLIYLVRSYTFSNRRN